MTLLARIFGGIVGLILSALAMSTYYLLDYWMIGSVILSAVGFCLMMSTSTIDIGDSAEKFFTDHSFEDVQAFLGISTIVCALGGIVAAFPFWSMIPSFLGDRTYEGGIIVSLISIGMICCLFLMAGTNFNYYAGGFEKKKKELEQASLQQEMDSKVVQNELLEKIRIFQEKHSALLAKYGKPVKEIMLSVDDIDKNIFIFDTAKVAWITGKAFPMKDILGCTLTVHLTSMDGDDTICAETIYSTRNNPGYAISPKNSRQTTSQYSGDFVHNYTLIVTINSLSQPTIRIPVGDDEKNAFEIAGLIDVIVKNNS